MITYQYMKTLLRSEICKEYDITNLSHNGFVYVKIRKGIYRLKEADIIAFKRLVYNLKPHGYHPVKHTPGLWRHKDRNMMFTLVVDDFGIKYFHMQDIQHLLASLQSNYMISVDMSGRHYCGLTLDYVDIYITGYINRYLQCF